MCQEAPTPPHSPLPAPAQPQSCQGFLLVSELPAALSPSCPAGWPCPNPTAIHWPILKATCLKSSCLCREPGKVPVPGWVAWRESQSWALSCILPASLTRDLYYLADRCLATGQSQLERTDQGHPAHASLGGCFSPRPASNQRSTPTQCYSPTLSQLWACTVFPGMVKAAPGR